MKLQISAAKYHKLVAQLSALNRLDVIRCDANGIVSGGEAYVVITVKPYYESTIRNMVK